MKKSNIFPLGYFITMRAYGTWLHGDKRLSVNRKNNQYDTPKIKRNGYFEKQMIDELKYPPIYFDQAKREIIKTAIENTCQRSHWHIYALHVRTNHLHIVLQADQQVDDVMRILKTNATILLRKKGEIEQDRKVWSRHGSTKYLWTDQSIYYTCEYTITEQGHQMANIDNLM